MRTFGLICLVGCSGFLIGRTDLARVQSQASRGSIGRNSSPPIDVEGASGIGNSETATDSNSADTIKLAGAEEVETANISDPSRSPETKHVYGRGLVVGLNGTGGRSLSTEHMALEYLTRLNLAAKRDQLSDEDSRLLANNYCQAFVFAKLESSAKKGTQIEAVVIVLDDAMSLNDGTLLFTELKGDDGVIYATAEGVLSRHQPAGKPQAGLMHLWLLDRRKLNLLSPIQ